MRKSVFDPFLPATIGKVWSDLSLWECHQCGQCSAVCPSQLHGGIRTREIIERAMLGAINVEKEETIWFCMMCQSCTERCQLNVNPSFIITLVRNLASERGNIPKQYVDEAKLFMKTGLSFPKTGLTKKMRSEMKLDDFDIDQKTMTEITFIVNRTRLGRLGF
ncbi:MAG: 4Fe-4S dicluster domain-containing protein [Methanomassiliicoccales archaeon]|nr:4Fe-4S dicluster domain-containing protein [Methanomassiliicoccales archaeon]